MRKLVMFGLIVGLVAAGGAAVAQEMPPPDPLVEETHRTAGAIHMQKLPFLEKMRPPDLPLPGPIVIPGSADPAAMRGSSAIPAGGNGSPIENRTVAKAEAEMKSLIRLLEQDDDE